MTAQREEKDRVVRRSEGIPVKKPELTERSRIIRSFFGNALIEKQAGRM